jgi:hypothetical protein
VHATGDARPQVITRAPGTAEPAASPGPRYRPGMDHHYSTRRIELDILDHGPFQTEQPLP